MWCFWENFASVKCYNRTNWHEHIETIVFSREGQI